MEAWYIASPSQVNYNESTPQSAHFSCQDGEVDAGVIFSLAEIAKDSQGLKHKVTDVWC